MLLYQITLGQHGLYYGEICRMLKVAMEDDADIMVKRRPGGLICRLEPDNT